VGCLGKDCIASQQDALGALHALGVEEEGGGGMRGMRGEMKTRMNARMHARTHARERARAHLGVVASQRDSS